MRLRSCRRALYDCQAGVMAFTLSQLFLGAITLGIALFRGTESQLGFHQEELVGLANYAASTLGSEHARAASSVADDNAIAAAIMGPRFAVEGDNITMDESAGIACPQWNNAFMQMVCAQYHTNKPRAAAKLAWARAEQQFVWSALSKLSGALEGVAASRAASVASAGVAQLDPRAALRVADPSQSGATWGAANGTVACTLARNDALASPMPGSAFPVLMPNLLGDLPKALVSELSRALCGAGGSPAGGGPPITLPGVPSVAKQTASDCLALEAEMRSEARRSNGSVNGWSSGFAADSAGDPADSVDVLAGGAGPAAGAMSVFSHEVAPYVTCTPATPYGSGASFGAAGSFRVRSVEGVSTCVFNDAQCSQDRLVVNSKKFLEGIGLPAVPAAPSLDELTRAPSDPDWNHSASFVACTFASKPVNDTVVAISDALRTIVSFGAAERSTALRDPHEYTACARWYFPDGEGPYASVPHDSQPFVSAWRFALTTAPSGVAP